MRIAQVAPLYESVPPRLYGGTERVVSYLTEELVKMGHDVTLFASGDSTTSARLKSPIPEAIRLNDKVKDPMAPHIFMLEQVLKEEKFFDIVHFHIDVIHLPVARRMTTPHVTTLHGRLDLPELRPLYQEFKEIPLVSISHHQRGPIKWANWQRTVYHGLPENLYRPRFQKGSYLAFLGRISPEKRPDSAIEIAKKAQIPIKIAAKVDKADREYFEQRIRPLLDHPLVEFIGEIGENEKNEFLGHALALVFPIDWPEPFGLVMIEAMACGTPVVALRRGSVPEVLTHGVTGFICDTTEEMVEAVKCAEDLDRKRIRDTFLKRFTAEKMAKDYLACYKELIEGKARGLRLAA